MLINGEKWACETCIKGHRATHCKHTERQLVHIKKKGRPSTQCKRCRELRVVRQLHVKCDCDDQGDRLTKKKKENSSNSIGVGIKKKIKIDVLRPIAPKQDTSNNYIIPSPIISSPTIVSSPQQPLINSPTIVETPIKKSGCCKSKNNNIPSNSPALSPPTVTQSNVSCCSSKSTTPVEPVPLPNIPPPSSCCGPPTKNQQGEMIRIVTCRCGDSCACIGCDAHPSRAMKEGKDDVYIGFDDYSKSRRLSIVTTTTTNLKSTTNTTPKPIVQSGTESEYPSSILTEDGFILCGCGCSKGFNECSDCLQELCNYL